MRHFPRPEKLETLPRSAFKFTALKTSALLFAVLMLTSNAALAQSMLLTFSNETFETTNVFSDIELFEFSVDIDESLAVGQFDNPPINAVVYRVSGSLVAGTPSGFPSFQLEREISGEDFYAQGSSLQFEIAETAVLEDGIQIAELAGADLVFRFDGREIDNGRFHPARVELRADGTGRIQNSNNIPTLDPLLEIDAGSEYIIDLVFDPGNTTLIIDPDFDPNADPLNSADPSDTDDESTASSGGGGSMHWFGLIALMLLVSALRMRLCYHRY